MTWVNRGGYMRGRELRGQTVGDTLVDSAADALEVLCPACIQEQNALLTAAHSSTQQDPGTRDSGRLCVRQMS